MLNQKANQNSLIFKKQSEDLTHGDNEKDISKIDASKMDIPDKHVTVNNIEYHNQILNSNDNFLVRYDDENKLFNFFSNDKQNTSIGCFSILQLIKYIVSTECLCNVSFDTSISAINTFVCIKNEDGIIIHDHIKSPFMGNLDTLIKLNNLLYMHESSNIFDDLDENNKNDCIVSLKIFNFSLLNHTLKIITSASRNKNITDDIKKKLLNYTVGIVYRMTIYTKNQVEKNMRHVNLTINNIKKIKLIRNDINDKLNKLDSMVSSQNDNVHILINKINTLQIQNIQNNQNNDSHSNDTDDGEITSDNFSLPAPGTSDVNDIHDVDDTQTNNTQTSNTQTNNTQTSNTNTNDVQTSNTQTDNTQVVDAQVVDTQVDDVRTDDTQVDDTQVDDIRSKMSGGNMSNVTLSEIIANFENSENSENNFDGAS